MTMPTDNATVRLARLRATMLSNATFVAETAPNRSYKSEINNFVKWVHRQRQSGLLPDGDKVVTRENLDHYFTMVVPYRNGVETTVNMIRLALTWYVKHRPIDCDPPNIVVVNDVVEAAYKAQKARHQARTKDAADPHHGLKDTMSESDKVKNCSYILNDRDDWGSAFVVNNMGHQVGTRGASMRAFVYCDMNLTTGFGPKKKGVVVGFLRWLYGKVIYIRIII